MNTVRLTSLWVCQGWQHMVAASQWLSHPEAIWKCVNECWQGDYQSFDLHHNLIETIVKTIMSDSFSNQVFSFQNSYTVSVVFLAMWLRSFMDTSTDPIPYTLAIISRIHNSGNQALFGVGGAWVRGQFLVVSIIICTEFAPTANFFTKKLQLWSIPQPLLNSCHSALERINLLIHNVQLYIAHSHTTFSYAVKSTCGMGTKLMQSQKMDWRILANNSLQTCVKDYAHSHTQGTYIATLSIQCECKDCILE